MRVMAGHSPLKTGVNALMPGHPRLPWTVHKVVDARHKAGHDEASYFRPTSSNHSSSVSTVTPASRALSSLEPAPGPATT